MRLLHAVAAALGSLPMALSLMEFRRPPAFTGLVDPSRNPVRVIGTTLDLEWTPSQEGKKLSVVLYQLNATRAATFEGQFHFTEGPFEFITRKSDHLQDKRRTQLADRHPCRRSSRRHVLLLDRGNDQRSRDLTHVCHRRLGGRRSGD
jgi:hypothetical protein